MYEGVAAILNDPGALAAAALLLVLLLAGGAIISLAWRCI